MKTSDDRTRLVISYLTLRTLIGALGIVLPVILVLGCLMWGGCTGIQDSISAYYYTGVGDIFVGVLFVVGFFLLAYKGYQKDGIVANFGFAFALGVALFPSQSQHLFLRVAHFSSAGLLFGVFAFFSLILFRKGEATPTPQKTKRNVVYLVCGILIVVFILCIPLSIAIFSKERRADLNLTFWFETLALWSFGFSWLVKGEVFWRDTRSRN